MPASTTGDQRELDQDIAAAGRFDSDGTPIVAIHSWKATSFALYAIENWNGDLVATGTPEKRPPGLIHCTALSVPRGRAPRLMSSNKGVTW